MRKMAAARRITRETFDAVVQEKMKKYRMNRDDAIDETIEQFQLQVPPPRPAPRPPLETYEEEFEDDGRYDSHPRGASRKWRDDLREEFPGPSFGSREYDVEWAERRRARSPFRGDERYYEGAGHPRSRDRDLGFVHPRSRDPSWSRKGDFDHLELDEFGSSEVYDDLQDYDPDYLEHPVPPSKFRGREAKVVVPPRVHPAVKPGKLQGLTRGAVAWKPKKPAPVPKKVSQKGPQLLLLDESDVFSKFSNQIVKWAGFDTIKDDDIFMEQRDALFQAETEACAKMLASFKCALKQGHRDYIFFCVQNLNHPALKGPKLDNEFLNLLIDKGIIKTKNCFFEIIKPFDKYLMNIQERLLKSVIPLLMACNAYEVDVKAGGLVSAVELSNALEKSISLCRKSLVLLGQTFSVASSYRQEKILEAVGLQEMAPNPTGFPNLDDCFLFGREYMAYLKRWLEKSGYPIQLQKQYQRLGENKAGLKLKAKSQADVLGVQPADPKVIEAIDQLVEYTNKNEKEKADEKEKPPFWFLFEENSLEYKYYRLKLAEIQTSRESTLDVGAQTKSSRRTPEELATESVRAMLYARKVTQLKRKLFRNTALSRRRKIKRVTAATQTVLSSSVMIKMQARKAQTSTRETASSSEKSAAEGSTSERYSPSRPTGSAPSPTKNEGSTVKEVKSEPIDQSEALSEAEILQIDAKTKDTAEKLAQFVAQVGPEIEKFSMENSASNPEFGFLHEPKSPAYRFYRMKVAEFRQTMDKSKDLGTSKQGAPEASAVGRVKAEVKAGASSPDKTETDMECEAAEAPNEGGLPGGVAPPARAPLPRKRVTSLKVGILPKKRVCLVEEPKVHDPVRIGYDRPRGRPAVRKVKQKPKDLEFANKKLTDQNVGFQMLRKMGWKEGQGLGSSGAGIKDPVKVLQDLFHEDYRHP
ncbi:SURP and G-patch domain-containing protein 2 isoform X2 [Microcaecilia unicolor]|uniref:SURP and G-patch domain-containing protein 2 isoform X2 n=2 Tax=Microcaecilia unicolor TaxID=1415580 RepID=A0A6P7ZQB7_9AMPH|nr:SURP and G-patch domain-containing protein 2 isoform X2 [Microcaecilia unicolor]